MIGKIKKVEKESKVTEVLEEQSEVPKVYLLSVEGFMPKVKAALEALPEGHIPIEAVFEESNLRKFGMNTYLFVIKTGCLDKRCTLVDAVGIKDLTKKLEKEIEDIDYIKILYHRVNKRTPLLQYLAIVVK